VDLTWDRLAFLPGSVDPGCANASRLAHPASATPVTPVANLRIISRRDWYAASGVVSLGTGCSNPDEKNLIYMTEFVGGAVVRRRLAHQTLPAYPADRQKPFVPWVEGAATGRKKTGTAQCLFL